MRPLPALTLAIALCAAASLARAAEPQTDEQKALYALGVAMSQNLASLSLTDAELEFVKAGLADGIVTMAIGTPLPALCKEVVSLMTGALEQGEIAVPGQSFLPFEIFLPENI